jgi:hypothetical protein
MTWRWLSSIVLAAVAAIVMSSALVAQTAKTAASKAAAPKAAVAKATSTAEKAYAKKTPWGDPDLQGVWNDATSTPLQRPAGKGGQRRRSKSL